MTTTVRESTDVDAIHDVMNRFNAAWTAHDPDAIAALYTEDTSVSVPGTFCRGRTALRDLFVTLFAGPLKGSRNTSTPLDVRMIDTHTAVALARSATIMAGEQSAPDDRDRITTWILSKQDGRWLVAALSSTPTH